MHIFTDNAAELGERLNHDVSKTSAMSFTKEEKAKESLIQELLSSGASGHWLLFGPEIRKPAGWAGFLGLYFYF